MVLRKTLLIMLVLSITILSGCTNSSKSSVVERQPSLKSNTKNTVKHTDKKVLMFTSDWPVWEISRAMSTSGKMPPEFDVKYRSYSINIDRVKDDTGDIAFLTLYDFIYTQRNSQNWVVIAATDYSAGGDKIVVKNSVHSVKDLLGKTWAIQTNSISLWLANLYMKKNGYSLNDIKIAHCNGEKIGNELLKSGKAIAAVGWNPNFSMIQPENGKVMVTSADFPENIFDVIIVRKESLEENKELYKKFIDQWFECLNDDKIRDEAAKNIGVSRVEYNQMLKDAHIYTSKEDSLKSFSKLKSIANDVSDFFSQKAPVSVEGHGAPEMFERSPKTDIDTFFDDSYLK